MTEHSRDSYDKESKIITELRKKNKKLISENQQLRKELRKMHSSIPEQFPEEDDSEPTSKEKVKKCQCPKCGVYIKNMFEICGKMYYLCECRSKGWVSKLQRG